MRISTVLEEVATYYHFTADDLRGHDRRKRLARARHVAIYLLRKWEPKFSSSDIGYELGGRDHSTVLYGARVVEARLAFDEELRRQVEILTEKLWPTTVLPAAILEPAGAGSNPRA